MHRRVTILAVLVICGSILLPTTLSAQEARTHTVVRGETLWALARRYYDNPFDWRRIYEANQGVIDNPHWIYPGEVLTIPGMTGEAQVTAVEVQGPQPAMAAGPCPAEGMRTVFYQGEAETSSACPAQAPRDRTIFYSSGEDESVSGRVLAGQEDPWMAVPVDIFYSADWLFPVQDQPDPPHLGTISEFRKEGSEIGRRTTARPYERIRIRLAGAEAPGSGDMLQSFRVTRTFEAGGVATPSGLLTVTAVTDSGVVAVVSNEYARVMLGDLVRPAPPLNLKPAFGADPIEDGPRGQILGFARPHEVQAPGDVGFVNLGSADGLQLGDELVALTEREEGWEDEVMGRVQVITVQEHQASVRIIQVGIPAFHKGTRVQVVARLP